MAKDFTKIRARLNGANFPCEYNGEIAKGTFGSFPQGVGEAVFNKGVSTQITQTGYWRKGDFLEGMTATNNAIFRGAFDNGYWVNGEIEFNNGDYIKGSFTNNTLKIKELKKSTSTNHFSGRVVAHDVFNEAKNSTEKKNRYMLVAGEWAENNGNLLQKGYFLVSEDIEDVQKNMKELATDFAHKRLEPQLVWGQTRATFNNGDIFRGIRTHASMDSTLNKNIANDVNGSSDLLAKGAREIVFPYDEDIGQVEPYILMPKDWQQLNLDFNDAKNATYYGVVQSGNHENGISYKIVGNFNIDCFAKSYSCVGGEFDIKLPNGAFKGKNNNIYLQKESADFACLNPEKYIKGVLKDDKNNILYKGIFFLEQNTKGLPMEASIADTLKFCYGDISVEKVNCTENFKILPTSKSMNGCYIDIDGKIEFTNGDYYRGEFELLVERDEPVSSKFVKGKLRKTVNTREENDTITVYTLSNDFKRGQINENGKMLPPKTTFIGSIEAQTKRNEMFEHSLLEGAFSGDFSKQNFSLLAGDIRLKRRVQSVEYDMRLKKTLSALNKVRYDGERIIQGAWLDGVPCIMHEVGEFKEDESWALVRGNYALATKDGARDYDLITDDGVNYRGVVFDRFRYGAGYSLAKKGEFVRKDLNDFVMNEGKIIFKTPDFKYMALFDKRGLEEFGEKCFAGTLKTQSGKSYTITTNSLDALVGKFELSR